MRHRLTWYLCIALLLGMFHQEILGQQEDTPEHPRLGAPRILPDQPFMGRFGLRYENYGIKDYPRLPPISGNLRNIYSPLGDSLLYGTEVVRWIEARGLGVQNGSTYLQERYTHGEMGYSFGNLFNYVVMGSESTDRWEGRLIYANELRSKFTPLTFKMSNLDGLRLDLATAHNKFSALCSRIYAPLYTSARWRGRDNIVKAKALLLGAHYEREIGFLHLGTTFVNAHQYEPLMSNEAHTLEGLPGAIQGAPALIALRISDDSPQDGKGGPILYDAKIYVNGVPRPDIQPFIIRLHRWRDERQSYVQGLMSSGKRKPLSAPGGDYQAINRGSPFSTYDPYIDFYSGDVAIYYRGYDFPFWIDHLYYRDFKLYGPDHLLNPGHPKSEKDVTVHTEFAHEQAGPSGDFELIQMGDLPQTFDGEEYGMLYVNLEPIGEYITSVHVDLTLANDYRVEVSEMDLAGQAPEPARPNYRDRYRYATFFRTVARASGNPQNDAPKMVRVKIGTPTGLSLYSVNLYGVAAGFRINAEFARSSSFYQYASGLPAPRVPRDALSINAHNREEQPGERHVVHDNAYYITVQRDFGRFGFGAEYFSMGPLYNTELRTYVGRDEIDLSGDPIAYNNTMIHRFVEDNDDNDRYPDSWYSEYANVFQGQCDMDGVFPGLDEDHDGIPDTNRDFDTRPDYTQPFLMYRSDPQVYDYGVDFNNNDYIDARENDWEADLPYDPDLRGFHGYGSFRLLRGLTFTLGLLDAQQIAGDAPSEALYSRLTYHQSFPTMGRFFVDLTLKRVHDGVPDHLSVYSDRVMSIAEQLAVFAGVGRGGRLSFFQEEVREDPLNYKNSLFTRLFIDNLWTAVPHLTMRNKIKYEVNQQQGEELYDGTFQSSDRLTRWAMVHTIDYTWPLTHRLSLFSGFKLRYLKEGRRSLSLPLSHRREGIPIVKLQYDLTEHTQFQIGVQGLGNFLPYTVTDLVRPEEDFRQHDAVFMITNWSRYRGYIISTNAGIGHKVKTFQDAEVGETGNERFTSSFVNVILGFED